MHARYVALLLPTMIYLSAVAEGFLEVFLGNEVGTLLKLAATIFFVCLLFDLELGLLLITTNHARYVALL